MRHRIAAVSLVAAVLVLALAWLWPRGALDGAPLARSIEDGEAPVRTPSAPGAEEPAHHERAPSPEDRARLAVADLAGGYVIACPIPPPPAGVTPMAESIFGDQHPSSSVVGGVLKRIVEDAEGSRRLYGTIDEDHPPTTLGIVHWSDAVGDRVNACTIETVEAVSVQGEVTWPAGWQVDDVGLFACTGPVENFDDGWRLELIEADLPCTVTVNLHGDFGMAVADVEITSVDGGAVELAVEDDDVESVDMADMLAQIGEQMMDDADEMLEEESEVMQALADPELDPAVRAVLEGWAAEEARESDEQYEAGRSLTE